MKFRCQKITGKIDINWDHLNIYASKWKDGTWFDLEIIRHQKKKSDPQRKMYFAAILPEFAKGLGYDPDEYLLFHRQLKIVYFQVEPDKKGIYRNVPHVFANESELVVPERTKFIEWVLRKSAMEGIYIDTKQS
jgi:hypothetical protein